MKNHVNENGHSVSATQEEANGAGQAARPHWSGRPVCLLIAALAVKLFLFLFASGASLPLALSETSGAAAMVRAVWQQLETIMVSLLAGGMFYWRIRCVQRQHGITVAYSWRMGIAFWAGLVLAAAYYALAQCNYFQAQPVLASVSAFHMLAVALVETLFLMLLFSAAERQMGLLKAALLASAAYALYSVVPEVTARLLTTLLMPAGSVILPGKIWTDAAPDMALGVLSAFAFTMLRASLYRITSRRVPGSWALAASVPGLLQYLLDRVILPAHARNEVQMDFSTTTLIDTTFYMLVFAISFCLLAAFSRWNSPKDVWQSVRAIKSKLMIFQDTDSSEKEHE